MNIAIYSFTYFVTLYCIIQNCKISYNIEFMQYCIYLVL